MMAGKVLILMGSSSDAETMRAAAEVLSGYGIPWEMTVASAHRSPGRTQTLARNAEKEGFSVIIAGAG
ncbi:MAG TPA: AIR carboxylase family protein, partial [Candidatus Deferrimicrobium sp.]|nr:AIR carboxylase family protein [Candidatus Deferrimicrobium sp.]